MNNSNNPLNGETKLVQFDGDHWNEVLEDAPQKDECGNDDEKEIRKAEFRGFKDDRRRFQDVQKHKMKGRTR
jgi:hypothetical protein